MKRISLLLALLFMSLPAYSDAFDDWASEQAKHEDWGLTPRLASWTSV